MSLQIAIQQIQMPSFWGANTPGQIQHTKGVRVDSEARRAEILKILRKAGEPMNYAALSALTGWPLFSLRNLINPMVADGRVIRLPPVSRTARALVRAA